MQESNSKGQKNGLRDFCPSCGEAFDSGKKRRLIDSCGHERCYTCMFSKELCSLCTFEGEEIQFFSPTNKLQQPYLHKNAAEAKKNWRQKNNFFSLISDAVPLGV